MMSMGMAQSQRLETRQEQRLEQRMTADQRLDQRTTVLIELLQSVHGENYQPQGDCPQCGRKLSKVEILRGFKEDPTDFTTECTGCHHRFQPKLACSFLSGAGRMELPFFCPSQTLGQLRGKEALSVTVFERDHPAVFRSARFHFGSVAAAFAQIGVQYTLEVIEGWKTKVRTFLGKLTDVLIASCVNVPVAEVRTYRREQKIPGYRTRRAHA